MRLYTPPDWKLIEGRDSILLIFVTPELCAVFGILY